MPSSRRQPALRPIAILLIALAGPISAAEAQTSEPYYAGKQIRMVIANGAGGAYDIYARILATHLSRHIPGSPSIIDQNMPIAAGMQATNWAYAEAPRDGTVIVATFNSVLAEPLYGNPAARYDPRRFEYVGSVSKQQNICGTWHTSPVKTIEQAKTREVIVTATGSASDSAILPRVLNAMLGTKFKVVLGYSSGIRGLRSNAAKPTACAGCRGRPSRSQAPNGRRNGCSTSCCRPEPNRSRNCPTCRFSSIWSQVPMTRRPSKSSRSNRRWAGRS